tara:strand:+ start:137 stop:688 length:552 start_codon:yes stop_codon:yes gene_type:complete
MGTLNLGNGASFTGGSGGFLSDAPKGQIIQIQHGIKTSFGYGAYDTSSPSVFKDTGLSVTITPTDTSSTILLQASFLFGGSRAGEQHYFRIVRGTDTVLQTPASVGNKTIVGANPYLQQTSRGEHCSFIEIDTSPVASSTTYKLQATGNNQSGTWYIGRTEEDTNAYYRPRACSYLIATELAG